MVISAEGESQFSGKYVKRTNEISSVKKALAILEAFSIDEHEFSVSQLSEKLGFPRPTVARLVHTLTKAGYLKPVSGNRKLYTLGAKLFRLNAVVNSSMQLTKAAAPILKELSERLDETVYLDIMDGYERVCILSFEGKQLLRSVVPVGQRSPLYAGADGKVLLAYQPDEKVEELINQGLNPLTGNTITDPLVLRRELLEIKINGVAVSFAECTPGSVGIACPVFDQYGEVNAGIGISSPEARINEQLKETYISGLKEAAQLISRLIGAGEGHQGGGAK